MLTSRAIFIFSAVIVEDYRKAVSYFDQAIRLDPNYALAYAERSEAWTFIGDLSRPSKRRLGLTARKDAEKAVAIAPNLAEAHAALGWVRFFVDWKFAEGLSELKRAKELSPANPTANDLLARVIVYLGRLDEAERQARQAVELDPLSVVAQGNLARVLFYAGKLDEADAAHAKPQSCSQPLLPIIAGRCWSLLSAVMVRRHCGKLNWSPMKAIAVSNSRSRTTSAAIASSRRGPSRSDCQWPRSVRLSNR